MRGMGGCGIPPDGGPCVASDNPRLTGCKGGDETGFFVSAAAVGVPDGGDAGGAGTRAKPYRTIGEAIAGLKTRSPTVPARIYVCGGDYAETVTLDETLGRGVQIYGQMSCTTWGWSWQSADRVRVKPTEGSALVVKGTTYPVTIEDVYFEGAAGSGYEDGGAGKKGRGLPSDLAPYAT